MWDQPLRDDFRKTQIYWLGLKPDPEKVRALQEMESPENVNDLHTFMRFVQYLGKCMPNLSEVYSPLR